MKTWIVNSIPTTFAMAFVLLTAACGETDVNNGGGSPNSNQWAIPQDRVFDGGPGKDGIPALENPKLITVAEASYLSDNDLVLGYKNGSEVRAYPHSILDWHEIINDRVDDHAFAITYCPLTGTGIGWDRVIKGEETTFGVSGLLFNSNLLPYDRKTDSNWSQMRLDCVNGELIGTEIQTFNLIETTWASWKSMYPDTKVVSTSTGFNRNYGRYPYGDYKTNNSNLLFPVSPADDRIASKERVLGIVLDGKSKVYKFSSFASDDIVVRKDQFEEHDIVIVGSEMHNFILAFKSKLSDGTTVNLAAKNAVEAVSDVIMVDDEGSEWDVFGEAVRGPRKGEKLQPVVSFIGYWFAWGAFYPTPVIFGME
ncbi:MAG: DUF3179 domain-containing protein [Cyclobacteriaceae bacterium]|nr:DUF3179 domain-containing protein [Cyclobacteriaceae bacterium]